MKLVSVSDESTDSSSDRSSDTEQSSRERSPGNSQSGSGTLDRVTEEIQVLMKQEVNIKGQTPNKVMIAD